MLGSLVWKKELSSKRDPMFEEARVVPKLLRQEVKLIREIGESYPEQACIAFDRFIRLPAFALNDVLPHVYAYFRDTYEWDEMAGELPKELDNIRVPEEVWQYVEPESLMLEEDEGKWFVCLEAECAWEPEHGLQIVWLGGNEIIKVGECDGHVTNVNAWDDPSLDRVVHKARDPRWTTTR